MNKIGQIQDVSTDVLIIGSGGAGLRAAIEAKRYGVDVLMVDKVVIGTNNNTRYSGGGFKAALPGLLSSAHGRIPETPYEHIQLALEHGEYLSDERLVEILCYQAPARILELKEFGIVPFGHPFGRILDSEHWRWHSSITATCTPTCSSFICNGAPSRSTL